MFMQNSQNVYESSKTKPPDIQPSGEVSPPKNTKELNEKQKNQKNNEKIQEKTKKNELENNKNQKNKGTYAQTVKKPVVFNRFFRTKRSNCVRIDFTQFGQDWQAAREQFAEKVGSLVPMNWRKHPKRPAYELVFQTQEEVQQLLGLNIEVLGQKVTV